MVNHERIPNGVGGRVWLHTRRNTNQEKLNSFNRRDYQ